MVKRPAQKAVKATRPVTKPKAAPKQASKPAKAAKSASKSASGAKSKSAPARVTTPYQPPPPPPPPPLAVPKPPDASAVTAFEHGMAALQKHNYASAKTIFETLVDEFPTEGFLTDSARVYLLLAVRDLQRRPAASGSVEERLTAATAALNNNDDAEAGRLAESAFKDDDSQDLAVYLMAIVAAREGRTTDALEHIRRAIEINPDSRVQARQDEEFDILLELDEFHTLTEAPPPPAPGAPVKKPLKKGR